jgi:flagellar motility protein MotE (MotC chaperone)
MDSQLIQLILSIGTFLVSGIAIYLSIKKSSFERKNLSSSTELNEAGTAEKYQEIADKAAERALKLEDRVDMLTKKVDSQNERIKYLEEENTALTKIVSKQQTELYLQKCQIIDLKTWAEALYKQVKDAGLIPIEFKSTDKIGE